MLSSLIIRPEQPCDHEEIDSLLQEAFLNHPHSNQTEHFIVQHLRSEGDLTLSIVAEIAEQIVGIICFSPVQLSATVGWYILGPLAVAPSWQRQHIGSLLIKSGLAGLQKIAARGCLVVGEPDFYSRAGFVSAPKVTLAETPAQYLLAYPFSPEELPQGEITLAAAFIPYL